MLAHANNNNYKVLSNERTRLLVSDFEIVPTDKISGAHPPPPRVPDQKISIAMYDVPVDPMMLLSLSLLKLAQPVIYTVYR
jgi:hypothetical protein